MNCGTFSKILAHEQKLPLLPPEWFCIKMGSGVPSSCCLTECRDGDERWRWGQSQCMVPMNHSCRTYKQPLLLFSLQRHPVHGPPTKPTCLSEPHLRQQHNKNTSARWGWVRTEFLCAQTPSWSKLKLTHTKLHHKHTDLHINFTSQAPFPLTEVFHAKSTNSIWCNPLHWLPAHHDMTTISATGMLMTPVMIGTLLPCFSTNTCNKVQNKFNMQWMETN